MLEYAAGKEKQSPGVIAKSTKFPKSNVHFSRGQVLPSTAEYSHKFLPILSFVTIMKEN